MTVNMRKGIYLIRRHLSDDCQEFSIALLQLANVAECDESFGDDAVGVTDRRVERRFGVVEHRTAAESGRLDLTK